MPDTASRTPQSARPVLPEAQVARQVTLLAELQVALTALGLHCMLVRNCRLVLARS